MIHGSINNICLSTSSFERIITEGKLYVDKTRVIENFLTSPSAVQLVARQRRLGKTMNMDMLGCFLTDKVDNRHLFKGLYIEKSPVWDKANSAPVFYFDFKILAKQNFKKTLYFKVCDYIDSYCRGVELSRKIVNYLSSNDFDDMAGLLHLTESVYLATGKRSYIFIDEYDKLLMESKNTEYYDGIREFFAGFISSGFKGNPYLEKGLLTGVLRISHESLLSGLNNIVIYDTFSDDLYTDDYGLTEEEVAELNKLATFDINEARAWYNGVRVNGKPIYNVYAMMSFLSWGKYDCYWGRSGTMDLIIDLLNEERKFTLTSLLDQEQHEVPIEKYISIKRLSDTSDDKAFYSLLAQAGYLSIVELRSASALVTIPNKELIYVWRNFIIDALRIKETLVRTLFDNVDNAVVFAEDLEYFLNDRLSYHDLAKIGQESSERAHEKAYHLYLLGMLSAFEDVRRHHPLSNRESGDGRYDICVQRPNISIIFELKACDEIESLDKKAQEALEQIDIKRYGVDLTSGKKLLKVGIAFHKKSCRVRVKKDGF